MLLYERPAHNEKLQQGIDLEGARGESPAARAIPGVNFSASSGEPLGVFSPHHGAFSLEARHKSRHQKRKRVVAVLNRQIAVDAARFCLGSCQSVGVVGR